ncbi:MAG: HNH endonuclease [Methylocella sp.]
MRAAAWRTNFSEARSAFQIGLCDFDRSAAMARASKLQNSPPHFFGPVYALCRKPNGGKIGLGASAIWVMVVEMTLCLFCPAELAETTKPEHILLNSLGGRKTTTGAICSACNNKFGGTIDNVLTSQVIALRNLLQLESGTGNPAPTLKNLQAGEHKVNIKGDGSFELVAKPFIIERLEDGRWNVQIQARSEVHLAKIVPHLAAALQVPEEHLLEQLGAARGSKITQRPGAVHHELAFGGPDAIRSMVKASLVLWSTLVGNDEVRSAPYDAARHFVVNGDSQFNLDRTHLDSRPFGDIERMKAAFGIMFNLICVRSDEKGRVVGHFTLYNAVAWQFTLAETGGTPNAKIALISNPLDPSQWSDRAADDFDVPFEWLNNPDYSDEMVRSKARFDAILKHYFDLNNPKAIGQIIEECFNTLNVAPGEAVPPDRLKEFSNLLGRRIALHTFSLPYEETLSPERKAEMFQKKRIQ